MRNYNGSKIERLQVFGLFYKKSVFGLFYKKSMYVNKTIMNPHLLMQPVEEDRAEREEIDITLNMIENIITAIVAVIIYCIIGLIWSN